MMAILSFIYFMWLCVCGLFMLWSITMKYSLSRNVFSLFLVLWVVLLASLITHSWSNETWRKKDANWERNPGRLKAVVSPWNGFFLVVFHSWLSATKCPLHMLERLVTEGRRVTKWSGYRGMASAIEFLLQAGLEGGRVCCISHLGLGVCSVINLTKIRTIQQ